MPDREPTESPHPSMEIKDGGRVIVITCQSQEQAIELVMNICTELEEIFSRPIGYAGNLLNGLAIMPDGRFKIYLSGEDKKNVFLVESSASAFSPSREQSNASRKEMRTAVEKVLNG